MARGSMNVGGGMKVNGIDLTYKLANGENINKGDLVRLEQSLSLGTNRNSLVKFSDFMYANYIADDCDIIMSATLGYLDLYIAKTLPSGIIEYGDKFSLAFGNNYANSPTIINFNHKVGDEYIVGLLLGNGFSNKTEIYILKINPNLKSIIVDKILSPLINSGSLEHVDILPLNNNKYLLVYDYYNSKAIRLKIIEFIPSDLNIALYSEYVFNIGVSELRSTQTRIRKYKNMIIGIINYTYGSYGINGIPKMISLTVNNDNSILLNNTVEMPRLLTENWGFAPMELMVSDIDDNGEFSYIFMANNNKGLVNIGYKINELGTNLEINNNNVIYAGVDIATSAYKVIKMPDNVFCCIFANSTNKDMQCLLIKQQNNICFVIDKFRVVPNLIYANYYRGMSICFIEKYLKQGRINYYYILSDKQQIQGINLLYKCEVQKAINKTDILGVAKTITDNTITVTTLGG